MVFECGRCKVASVGTGNGHLRGTGRKQLCLGPGMGLGGGGWLQSGGRTGNKADTASLICLVVHLGYSLGNVKSRRPLWLGVDDGTRLARGSYGLWWE